jgi:hypothetical protein
MKYYVFDTAGALLSSLDTRTGSMVYVNAEKEPTVGQGSNTGSTSGDNVSVIPRAILPLATFWTDTSPMPTRYRQMDFPIVQYGTSHPSTMAAESAMNSPGYISSVSGGINGGTNGLVFFQVYKNGEPTGVIARGQSTGNKKVVSAKGATSNTFVAGDVLSVWIRGEDSGTNQSFSATIEVTFTA